MPNRKRTRTTATEAFVSRGDRHLRNTRREIANEAARIMATEGQRNFRVAKLKAAARIGVKSRLSLPGNREIEQALREYQGFFGGDQHIRQLGELRQTALHVMRALEGFFPRLVGPVLEGTADSNSRVCLHVFSDPPEAIAAHLSEKGIPYKMEERRIRWHDGNYRQLPLVLTEANGIIVELALFNRVDLRQSPPSPVDGRPQKRAAVTEVEILLGNSEFCLSGT